MRGVSSENVFGINPVNVQESSKNSFIWLTENIKNFLWKGLGYQESDRSSSASERYSISTDRGSISSQSTLSRISSSIKSPFLSIASMFGAKAQKNPEINRVSPRLESWLQTPDNSPSEPHLDNPPSSNKTLEEVRETDTATETGVSSSLIEELKKKFIEKIDQYSVRGFEGAEAIKEQVGTYLDANAVQKLHEGCTESTEARQKFINFLLDRKITPSTTIDKLPIPLSKLLGKEGEKLYKAALAEEHDSASFRSAVFLASSSKRGF